jgi:hypothetical protein
LRKKSLEFFRVLDIGAKPDELERIACPLFCQVIQIRKLLKARFTSAGEDVDEHDLSLVSADRKPHAIHKTEGKIGKVNRGGKAWGRSVGEKENRFGQEKKEKGSNQRKAHFTFLKKYPFYFRQFWAKVKEVTHIYPKQRNRIPSHSILTKIKTVTGNLISNINKPV